MRLLCDDAHPGTREGFILVVETPPTDSGVQRRAQLADFLKRRRAALRPEDVGLPATGRRRTPGLRREEVATIAGVGATWYTWLEQARDVRASVEVLEGIATALELTEAERTHLLLLGRGETAPAVTPALEHMSPAVRRLVEGLGANPAYVLGRRWDYLAVNDAAVALLGDIRALPRAEQNHVWLTFMEPARRELFTDWPKMARLIVAKFRADSARHIGDPAFEELISALRRASPEFCAEWKRHEVARHNEGRKELMHPVAGRLAFEHAVFHPSADLEQRMVLYSPLPDYDTQAKIAALLRPVAAVA